MLYPRIYAPITSKLAVTYREETHEPPESQSERTGLPFKATNVGTLAKCQDRALVGALVRQTD